MSENLQILSAVHGIAPRSDELLRLGADFERGRVSGDAFDELIDQETTDWLNLQEEAGIDFREDGKLRWQDHLRPIVKATTGFDHDVDAAPVTRWFENNRFFRQPTITDQLILDPSKLIDEIKPQGDYISLLSPISFLGLCNQGVQQAPEYITQLYDDIARALSTSGVRKVLFLHYSSDPQAEERICSETRQFVETAKRFKQYSIELSIHVPGSRVRHGFGSGQIHLDSSGVPDGVSAKREFFEPIIDATTTRLEDVFPENWVADPEDRPTRHVLTHNYDLELLPLSCAKEKIKRLGQIAYDLRERLGE